VSLNAVFFVYRLQTNMIAVNFYFTVKVYFVKLIESVHRRKCGKYVHEAIGSKIQYYALLYKRYGSRQRLQYLEEIRHRLS